MTDPQYDYFNPKHSTAPDRASRLHPVWSLALMWTCQMAAIFVATYAFTSDYTVFGVFVVGVLLLAMIMIYRTS